MAKPTTQLGQQTRPPRYTHWDQRGTPVLLTDLELLNGKCLRLSLKTGDPDIAKRHMRLLVPMLVRQGRLSPDAGAAEVYGAKKAKRSRFQKLDAEIRWLKPVSDAA